MYNLQTVKGGRILFKYNLRDDEFSQRVRAHDIIERCARDTML
jgi:hypothetical protein